MVQLSKYFVWFVSLFAVATSLIACSDDADEGTLLPEMVGDWDIVDSYEAIYIDGKETTTNRDPWNGNTYKFMTTAPTRSVTTGDVRKARGACAAASSF